MIESPLVSVVVIAYNSAEYITNVLESIYKQSYRKLELIISDDCSTDETVDIVHQWLDLHKNDFIRTKLVESFENTGVAPNVNRGVRVACGEWIKVVSGDDKLPPNSISDYVDFVLNKPECSICFGKFRFWGDNPEIVQRDKDLYEKEFYPYLCADWDIQWKHIQETLFVPGPGLFYKKKLFDEVDGLDERFPFADEYPFTYNILEKGYRIYFLDKEVYDYQIHANSLCRTEFGPHPRVFSSQYAYVRTVHCKKLLKYGFLLLAFDKLVNYYVLSMKYKKVSNAKYYIVWCLKLFSPYTYIRKIRYLKRALIKTAKKVR